MDDKDILPDTELGPLQRIRNPEIFRAGKGYSEQFCQFILLLAVVYNDFKDLQYLRKLLNTREVRPFRLNRYHGQYWAMSNHLIRLEVGLINELIYVMKSYLDVSSDPLFLWLLKNMPKPAVKAWSNLNELARGDNPKDKGLLEILKDVRSKSISHYVGPEIYRAFQRRYSVESAKPEDQLYISMGSQLKTTRYYFADGAIYAYLEWRGNKVPEIKARLEGLLDNINTSLKFVVESYLARRKAQLEYVNDEMKEHPGGSH